MMWGTAPLYLFHWLSYLPFVSSFYLLCFVISFITRAMFFRTCVCPFDVYSWIFQTFPKRSQLFVALKKIANPSFRSLGLLNPENKHLCRCDYFYLTPAMLFSLVLIKYKTNTFQSTTNSKGETNIFKQFTVCVTFLFLSVRYIFNLKDLLY